MRRFRLPGLPSLSPIVSVLSLVAPLLHLAAFTPLRAQPPATPPPFVETIDVREVEVRVDLAALPKLESIGKRGREDFLVVEDGVDYPLTELGPAERSQWIFLLYFDSTLADAAARQSAAIALAREASLLTAGGLAEIVVADPQPHVVLSTASTEALRQRLNEIALGAGNEAKGTSGKNGSTGAPGSTSVAARLAQLDRLTVEIAARGGGGSRALLLPVGSWPVDAETLARLSLARHAKPEAAATPSAASSAAAASDPPTGASEFRPLLETSRVLAGYGWVTLPIALRPAREDIPGSAAERRMQSSTGGGGDRRESVPILSLPLRDEHPDSTTETQLDVVTDFTLMPFAELSRATSGALIGQTDRLQSALGDLVTRRQFTYRSPSPAPGRLLPLEVRWKGGDGRLLSAPRWLRASTPPEVSAARLRRLLAGDRVPEGSKIQLSAGSSTSGQRICFPGAGEKLWVRLSSASEAEGQVTVTTSKPVELTHSADGFCTDTPAHTVRASRWVTLAENLDDESWTGAVTQGN
ncbi:MAG: hypothetical protein ABI639_14995 [Thermoanaerobaculia bacterium]